MRLYLKMNTPIQILKTIFLNPTVNRLAEQFILAAFTTALSHSFKHIQQQNGVNNANNS